MSSLPIGPLGHLMLKMDGTLVLPWNPTAATEYGYGIAGQLAYAILLLGSQPK
mgnify:CR=1 FL=1